ncbi:hypothetical protein N7540_008052 [Penicillium herquei]|nr:hypothetical protein N7540_008052 [Penicillium herquei]
MDFPESYPPGIVLTSVAKALDAHQPDLRLSLPSNRVSYDDALNATLECVQEIEGHILLPTTNPIKRDALRRMALENQNLEESTNSLSRRIRTEGKLQSVGLPVSLSPERRETLKKNYFGENVPPRRDPYVLQLRALRTETTLMAVLGNVTVSAIDWESGLPKCDLEGVEMLWDTGAHTTIITKDLLSNEFQAHLSDQIHLPYRSADGTRVHVSFILEFSNTLFHLDSIATVVDRALVPNVRSGIILGQKGFIDAIQYKSITRSILLAQGETVDEALWGDLILEKYIDLDKTLKEVV